MKSRVFSRIFLCSLDIYLVVCHLKKIYYGIKNRVCFEKNYTCAIADMWIFFFDTNSSQKIFFLWIRNFLADFFILNFLWSTILLFWLCKVQCWPWSAQTVWCLCLSIDWFLVMKAVRKRAFVNHWMGAILDPVLAFFGILRRALWKKIITKK